MLNKTITKTGQCPTEQQADEDNGKEEFKTDKLPSDHCHSGQILLTGNGLFIPEFKHSCFSGYLTRPFLPPR